jgi:hypothetical protein
MAYPKKGNEKGRILTGHFYLRIWQVLAVEWGGGCLPGAPLQSHQVIAWTAGVLRSETKNVHVAWTARYSTGDHEQHPRSIPPKVLSVLSSAATHHSLIWNWPSSRHHVAKPYLKSWNHNQAFARAPLAITSQGSANQQGQKEHTYSPGVKISYTYRHLKIRSVL